MLPLSQTNRLKNVCFCQKRVITNRSTANNVEKTWVVTVMHPQHSLDSPDDCVAGDGNHVDNSKEKHELVTRDAHEVLLSHDYHKRDVKELKWLSQMVEVKNMGKPQLIMLKFNLFVSRSTTLELKRQAQARGSN